MPYVPRPATTIKCAHCKTAFESHHASRKYCSNSCNVLASYARTGYRGEPRASRADLERTLAKMMELMKVKPDLAPREQAAPRPAAKAAAKPPTPKPTVKAATKPAVKKPAAKAAVKTPSQAVKADPTPTKKVAKQAGKAKKPAVRIINL